MSQVNTLGYGHSASNATQFTSNLPILPCIEEYHPTGEEHVQELIMLHADAKEVMDHIL
jgi:hypothetical protein